MPVYYPRSYSEGRFSSGKICAKKWCSAFLTENLYILQKFFTFIWTVWYVNLFV